MQKSVEATCRLLTRQGLAHTGFDWCPDVDVHHQFPDPLGFFCFVFVFNLYLLVIVLFLFSTVVDLRFFFYRGLHCNRITTFFVGLLILPISF